MPVFQRIIAAREETECLFFGESGTEMVIQDILLPLCCQRNQPPDPNYMARSTGRALLLEFHNGNKKGQRFSHADEAIPQIGELNFCVRSDGWLRHRPPKHANSIPTRISISNELPVDISTDLTKIETIHHAVKLGSTNKHKRSVRRRVGPSGGRRKLPDPPSQNEWLPRRWLW